MLIDNNTIDLASKIVEYQTEEITIRISREENKVVFVKNNEIYEAKFKELDRNPNGVFKKIIGLM